MAYNFLTHLWVTLKGKCTMKPKDKKRYDNHYQQLLKCLKLQGKADVTIDHTPAHLDVSQNTLIVYLKHSRKIT